MISRQHSIMQRSLVMAGGATYIVLLHLVYVHLIAPVYGYMGYTYESPGFSILVISGLLAALPLLGIPVAIRRPSQVVYWVLYLIVYVPSMMIPLYTLPNTTGLWQFVLVLAGCFILLGVVYAIPTATLPRIRLEPKLFWTVVALMSLACYGLIFSRFGFQIRLVALTQVYDLRSAYREDLESNGRLVAYAMAWQANVLNPLVIGYGLSQRQIPLVMVGFIGQLALYSITGLKGVLFSTMLIVLINIAFGLRGKRFGLAAIWGTSSVIIVATLLDFIQNSTLFVSLFVRRLIVTSGLLTGFYFDFFSVNEKAKYAYSFLGGLFDYHYEATPAFVIGAYYFGNPSTSANANVWADGFSNFGYAGVVVVTLLLGGLFWIYDSLMSDTGLRLSVLFLGIPSISLASSSLPVALLTHGIGLVLLLAFLMPQVRRSVATAPMQTVPSSNRAALARRKLVSMGSRVIPHQARS
jgi:hypothetical protein